MTHTEELVATLVTPTTKKKRRRRGCYNTKKYTDEQWEFIFELHSYGYSAKELGEWLGVSYKTVAYHFERLGLYSTKRFPLSTYDDKLRKLGDTHARP